MPIITLKKLSDEKNKFTKSYEARQSARENASKTEIQDLEKSILLKDKKIKELMSEIENEKKLLDSKRINYDESIQKNNVTRDNYYSTYDIVTSEILSDIEKIKNYLA